MAEDVPGDWREAIETAARRWERVIRAELPEVELATDGSECPTPPPGHDPMPPMTGPERGVRVWVWVSRAFPAESAVIAAGGSCLSRGEPNPTTVIGDVALNWNQLVGTVEPRRRAFVVVHELGHVLGLAGEALPFPARIGDRETGTYRGPFAREGHRRHFGEPIPEQLFDTGRHWEVPRDVMSRAWSYEITALSVGALMDLGYPAAWYGAGTFLEDFGLPR